MWNRDIASFQRSFPRTMRDAFKGPDYACAVEKPTRLSTLEQIFVTIIVVASVALILATLAVIATI